MKKYILIDWQDYWKIFDELIDLLNSDGKTEISSKLRDAQKHNNGLTDGWYEFMFAFERVLKSDRQIMTKEQWEIADFLINELKKSLKNR
ncbi:MAG: hypothetical protein H6585_03510 [Flavobacteriales bacterium]|nr:hypothetical protein [Flavobacteriales bacterium]MCB9447395.1 hypothetical protein [Flavobacteriales bacterium]